MRGQPHSALRRRGYGGALPQNDRGHAARAGPAGSGRRTEARKQGRRGRAQAERGQRAHAHADAVRPGSDRGRSKRRAGPGDRPGRGDGAHHTDSFAPHQEQPRAHRRARRGQVRGGGGAGAEDRGGRRARAAGGQAHRVARPCGHARGRKVPRRVRGAHEERDAGAEERPQHHPVHRRAAHADRRGRGGGRH